MEKKDKKLKILAFGDLHGDKQKAKELADLANKEDVDLVVMCGDLIQSEHGDISKLLGIFKKRVLLIPGNHESVATIDTLAELYDFKNLHGYYSIYKDIGLIGCGSANIGLFQLSEENIFHTLKKGFDKIKDCKKKIIVTHNHPSDSKMECLTKFVPGSKGIKKIIDEYHPDILFCCHVHEGHGMEEKIGNTRVINVGRDGKILEL